MTSDQSDLPRGWAWSTIGACVDVLDSRRVPLNKGERALRPGNVPYYGATGQVGWIDDPIFNEELVLLGEDGAPFLDPAKSKAYMITGPSWVNNHAHVLRTNSEITSNRFLMHWLNACSYEGHVTGTTRLKLNQAAMRAMPVPVPPCAEQSRIVDAIEEHLSRLGAAETTVRSARLRLQMLEQSVLDGAVRGDIRRLGDCLAEPLRNGFSAGRSDDGDTRVVTLTAVTKRSFVDEYTKVGVVPKAKRDELLLHSGDVLIQRSNTPQLVGSAAMYSGPDDWAVFPDLLIRVRSDETLLPAYLDLALRTTRVRQHFRKSAQGIAGSMPKISQSTIEDCLVQMPPSVNEQQEIVDGLDQRLHLVNRLGSELEAAKQRAASLRRSVLAAAFSGRAVAQDPSDASADALLARIAAERPPTGSRRKRARA